MPTTWFEQNAPAEAAGKDWFTQNSPQGHPPPPAAGPHVDMQEMNLLDSSNAGHPSKGVSPAGKLTHLPGVDPHTPTTKEGFNDAMLAGAPLAATASPGQIVRGIVGGAVGSEVGTQAARVAGLGKTGTDFAEMGGGVTGAAVGAKIPELAQTKAGRSAAVISKAAGKLPVVDKFVRAGKTLGQLKDVWVPKENAPSFPQYPGAHLPEDPGVFPGANLPEAPSKPTLQARSLEKPGAAPPPEPSAALGNTKFPQYSKPAVPKSATVSDTAVHPDAAQFEEIYKQPLSNYLDESGKFNTKDFLSEVVKPRTEPPNAVITRTFGSDGVDLVSKLNGKPLAKWESSAPEGEPQGGTARLAAKEAKAQPGRVMDEAEAEHIKGDASKVVSIGPSTMQDVLHWVSDTTKVPLKSIGHGSQRAAFESGNHVVKIGNGPLPEEFPSNPWLAKRVQGKGFKGASGADYHASVEPKLDTKGITAEDVRTAQAGLKETGYTIEDASPDNLGRDSKGHLRFFDGTVHKSR